MPETVDKSSLSTLFPKYSPQPCLIVFFHAAPFPRGLHRSLPLLSQSAPPASGFSLSLFCFFFATSPFLCLHLSSFLLRLAYFLAVLCHAFFGCCREGFLISARVFSFLFSARCASPLATRFYRFVFLLPHFAFATFCFCLILLFPHFAFAASSSAYGFLLSFAFPGRDACAFIPPCYTVHIFSLSQLYEHIHTQGGSQHDR